QHFQGRRTVKVFGARSRPCLAFALVGACLLAGASKPSSAQSQASPQASGGSASPPIAGSFDSAKAALLQVLAAKDFEARLEASVAALSPPEAAALDEFFAPRVSSPAMAIRLYTRASSLRLLLGDFASAAKDSESVAAVLERGFAPEAAGLAGGDGQAGNPGSGGGAGELVVARLRAARLWLAAGETELASRLAALVITSTKDAFVVDEARLVAAWASLLSGSKASALALAGDIADPAKASSPVTRSTTGDDRREELRREAVFLLWAGSDAQGREVEARRLAADWPGSPEAAITQDSPTITLMALPHWYLGGMALLPESRPPEASSDAGPLPGAEPLPGAGPTAGSEAVSGSSPEAGGVKATRGGAGLPLPSQAALYQVGVFSSRDHAQSLVDELRKKGFVARIEVRQVGNQALLAVVLSQKDNKDRLGERLKDAGYEAWLLSD
ncbi:MAG: SPOR domain-containing protein, partial [Treponema sp.]|nr:SPOR domain-containing protein [Treponema sp.]